MASFPNPITPFGVGRFDRSFEWLKINLDISALCGMMDSNGNGKRQPPSGNGAGHNAQRDSIRRATVH